MTTRMLIDARHPEETRVAVVQNGRIEEFDFESAEHKQLKGNIYLAKVTRVEPSLQAAFVDYGGNRHGFLAFSEIHPDYYQIPQEDRDALLQEEAEHAAEEEELRAREEEQEENDDRFDGDDDNDDDGATNVENVSTEGGEESAVEKLRKRRLALRRRYKIQDVIRRRQVLLVQVVKEERGNKGAALTTYLSLAGRYCVLMPNTSHGGGISRKISNAADRKRLKGIMAELDLPKTMGCIVRTAGLQRTKTEIKRDFDYLARLWDEIRENTLQSTAPALVYGDSDLIKRAIRDIYNRDIEEVIVEGEEGFRAARSFMKLLMPSHVRKVVPYIDTVPLFQRYGVEDQLAAMYHPIVQLKSGGYLVINPTEALVSIDINSGRSTREHNIEQTATATNLEAAAEIARQLRLRDMAGLVVIDFIDMENSSNIRKVEKALKEALKNDRARIQVGRISSFGLFEMSRQRLRTGVLEASTRPCAHCEGTGLIRTASSAGLSALRMIEEEAARGRGNKVLLRASQEATLYVLNRKRKELATIEERYGVSISVLSDGTSEGARMTVEVSGPPPAHAPRLPERPPVELDELIEDDFEDEIEEEIEAEEADMEAAAERGPQREENGEGGRRKRRRRRRGRGRGDEQDRGQDEAGAEADESSADAAVAYAAEEAEAETADAETDAQTDAETDAERAENGDADIQARNGEEGQRRRSRRGRRGGRRRQENGGATPASADEQPVAADSGDAAGDAPAAEPVEAPAPVAEPVAEAIPAAAPEAVPEKPKTRRRPRARAAEAKAEAATTAAAGAEAPVVAEQPAEAAPKAKPARRRKAAAPAAAAEATAAEPAEAVAEAVEAADAAAEAPAEAPAEPVKKARAPRTRKAAATAEKPAAKPRTRKAAAAAPAEAAPEAPEAVADAAAEPAAAPTVETPAEPAGDAPARRGWWQRTFGN